MINGMLNEIIEGELWMLALTKREQRILFLRRLKNPRTLKAIGLELEITRERVRQIEKRAKEKEEYKRKIIEGLNIKITNYLKEKNG